MAKTVLSIAMPTVEKEAIVALAAAAGKPISTYAYELLIPALREQFAAAAAAWQAVRP